MTEQPNGTYKGLAILGRNGIIGVMLGLLILTGFVIYISFKQSSNHIQHSTEAIIEVKEAIVEFNVNSTNDRELAKELSRNQVEVTSELTDAIRDIIPRR